MKILRTAYLRLNLSLEPTGHEVGLLFTGHDLWQQNMGKWSSCFW
jgi:hypothetical protein